MDELLDLAAEVFIADGFQGASVNVIARRAGASKASLYSRFPSKEDLFLAVLEHRMNRIFQAVVATIPDEAPLRDALSGFGTGVLQSALSDAQMALIRVVSMETVRFPQLGRRFFDLGPGRGMAALTTYIKGQIHKKVLRNEDPKIMAQQFLGMVAGAPLIFRLFGMNAYLKSNKQQAQHLALAIEAFVRAYGT